MATQVIPRPTRSGNEAPASKRNWLAEIKTTVKGRPTAAIIYGVPGIGKTSMAAHAPDPIFLTDDKEDGITTLKSSGLVPANIPQLPAARSWSDVLGMLDSLASETHDRKTLVIDTIGGLESLCHAEVTRREFNGDVGEKGFIGYQRGYDVSLTDWRLLLNALDRVRDEKQMAVILLAHSKVETFKNPEAADYDKYVPDVHKKTWSVTNRWADAVLFLNYLTVVQSKDPTKKGKASGGQLRLMYTQNHASYDAKNRHNLETEIPMGESGAEAWGNLVDAIKAGRKSN